MKENGFFKGFSDRGYLAVYRGMAAEDLISEAKHRKEKPDPKKIEEEGNEIFGAMAAYFGKGFSPNSEEVQAEVNQHYQMLDRCCEMSKGLYLAYAQLYVDHPDVRKYFDDRDPDLAERTAESMTLYAQRVL